MSKLNISAAAKAAGKSRTTIYDYIKRGELSCEVNDEGQKVVDTAELIRVFGEITVPDEQRPVSSERPQVDTIEHQPDRVEQVLRERITDLEKQVEDGRKREEKLLNIIEKQTNLLPAGRSADDEAENSASEVSKMKAPEKAQKQSGWWQRLWNSA